MSAADDILSQIPLTRLAEQLGLDETSTEQAVRQAVPGGGGGLDDLLGRVSRERVRWWARRSARGLLGGGRDSGAGSDIGDLLGGLLVGGIKG